ncbi:MAG: hypothetical protein EP307_02480 [Rhodobacteraceae bacterium]|nr:MAG: hypothetical protein EP307_02480 [Paracoccaceae bacterium]
MQIMNLRTTTADTVIGLPANATAQAKPRTSFEQVLLQVPESTAIAVPSGSSAEDGAQGGDATGDPVGADPDADGADVLSLGGVASNAGLGKAEQAVPSVPGLDLGPDGPSPQGPSFFLDRATPDAAASDPVAALSPSPVPDPAGTPKALPSGAPSMATPMTATPEQEAEAARPAKASAAEGGMAPQQMRPDPMGAASAPAATMSAPVGVAQAGGPAAPMRPIRQDVGFTQQANPLDPVRRRQDWAEAASAITPPLTPQADAPMSRQAGTPPGWVLPRPAHGGLPGMLATLGGVQPGEAFLPTTGETGLPGSEAPRQTAAPAPAPATAALPFRPVAMQIAMALPAAADGSVEITLSPRELGQVRLSLSPGETGLVLTMVAERPETLDMLRRHAAELGHDLRSLGYHDVDFRFGGSSGRDPSPDLGGRRDQDLQGQSDIPAAAAPEGPAPRPMLVSGSLDIRL